MRNRRTKPTFRSRDEAGAESELRENVAPIQIDQNASSATDRFLTQLSESERA